MTSISTFAPSGGRRLLRSGFVMPAILVAIVAILVVAPLVRILLSTLTPEGIAAWQAVLVSPLSFNLWWRPLFNTMVLGFGVASGCLILGGFLAWLVVLTDVPGRRLLGLMGTLPYMIRALPPHLPGERCFGIPASAVPRASSRPMVLPFPTGSPGGWCRPRSC